MNTIGKMIGKFFDNSFGYNDPFYKTILDVFIMIFMAFCGIGLFFGTVFIILKIITILGHPGFIAIGLIFIYFLVKRFIEVSKI